MQAIDMLCHNDVADCNSNIEGYAVAGGGTYQALRQGRINMLPTTNVVLVNLIRSLMSTNPADRPSPEKILSSSLFAKRAQKENKPQHGFGGLNLQPSRVA